MTPDPFTCYLITSTQGETDPLNVDPLPLNTRDLFRDWSRSWTCLHPPHIHPNIQYIYTQMHTLSQDAYKPPLPSTHPLPEERIRGWKRRERLQGVWSASWFEKQCFHCQGHTQKDHSNARSESPTWDLVWDWYESLVFLKNSLPLLLLLLLLQVLLMHESLSAHPPAHIELEVKQKAWLLFGGRTIILSILFFLEYMYRVITRCVIFVPEYKHVDLWGRCLGSRLEAKGCGCWNKTWKDKKVRSILWFFSGSMRRAKRKPKGGKKPKSTLQHPVLAHFVQNLSFFLFVSIISIS